MASPALRALMKARIGTLTPTGWALVRLVKIQGDTMLSHYQQDKLDIYRQDKELYLELLVLAERDAIAGPYLTMYVQQILDEESHLYRMRQSKQG